MIGESELERDVRTNVDAAIDYLRSSWERFANLSPEIIDLQHRAAVIAYNATQAGDTTRADQAKAVIRALGTLNVKHGQALDTMRSVAEFVGIGGLSGYYTGLGLVIPAAQVTVITSLALVVVWAFRAYAAESRKLDLLEQGVITPEDFRAMDPGPAPSMLFAGASTLAKFAVAGLGLYVVLQLVPMFAAGGARRARRNPPLVVFERNPPADVIGEQVLAVWYRHAKDGKAYVHKFGDDVELLAEPDGSVRLEHRSGAGLWADFDVDESDEFDDDDYEELPELGESDDVDDSDDDDEQLEDGEEWDDDDDGGLW